MKNNFNEHARVVRGIAPQAITVATVKGSGIDRKGYEEAGIALDVSEISDAATLNVKVQESDDDVDGNYADVTGAAFAQVATGATDDKLYVGRLNLVARKRWIRVVAVGAAGTGGTFAATVTLTEKSELPASQVNTLSFNVG